MSSSRKAVLGRGLNALLPAQEPEPASDREPLAEGTRGRLYHFEDRVRLLGRVADVDVDQVRPNPYQPRRDFDEKTLDELAASLLQLGVIQPITVRVLEDNRFEVISGERRLRAARRAGLKRIPAYIREADTEEMLEMALVENVQREALNPIEIALGYQRLIEECALTQEQVAQKVGKNRATVANILRLLKLPPRIQAAVRDGTLTTGHARAMINVEDEEVQLRLLKEVEERGLSVREVEDLVRDWTRAPEPQTESAEAETAAQAAKPAMPDRDALQLRAFADQLRSRYSTQVHIRHRQGGTGGRIEIAYYSDEDLERLLEILLPE